MTRKQLLTTAAAITIIVAVTTWPFRSERLISWDAANFAFALQKIDIATHRPHPPGYLGYVFAGRALSAWNVIVRSAAGLLIVLLAFSATDGSVRAAMASAAILLTSPLLWFYASNAEIYPSEMALSLAAVNLAQAALFVPSVTPPGTPIVRYRDKTLLQGMASDLQPLTFPTRATIRRSDAAVNHLLSLASDCIGGTWVVVAGAEPVDWRRASYYLPRATAIRLSGDDLPEYIGHGGDFVHVSPDPAPIASTCGLLWMSNAVSLAALPTGGRHIEELGWVFPPGSGQVSSAGVI